MNLKNRVLSLDLIKFFGLSTLMLWHTLDWIFMDGKSVIKPEENLDQWMGFWQIGMDFFLILCLALPFGAGISFFFFQKKNNNKKIIYRGIYLIGFGLLLNLFRGIDDLVSWDILHFVGLSSIITMLLPKRLIYFLIPIITLGTEFIRDIYFSAIKNYIENPPFILEFMNNAIFGDPFGESYYPLLPWLSLFLFGYLIGDIIDKKENKNPLLVLGIITLPFFIIYRKIWTLNIDNVWGTHIFQPNTLDYVGVFSIISILFYSLLKIPENKIKPLFSKHSPIRLFSKYILPIFIFHSITFYITTKFIITNEYRYDLSFIIGMGLSQYIISYIFVLFYDKLKS